MIFRSEYKANKSELNIGYKDSITFLGSCFADNLYSYLYTNKFDCKSNPFGTLYHPLAISKAIALALSSSIYDDFVFKTNNELWASYDVHSSLNRPTKKEFLENFELQRSELKEALLTSNYVFISFGTANVYRNIASNSIVANCQKIPQHRFKKELLSLSTIIEALSFCVDKLTAINPKVKIIFTLSPVRYLRDGFEENQLSKSLLYVAIASCVSRFKNLTYFPSYEYILDDLRDYRYFEKDLTHPNELALDYIWGKFKETYFDLETLSLLKKVSAINNRLNHKIFYPDTLNAKEFSAQTRCLLEALESNYPFMKHRF